MAVLVLGVSAMTAEAQTSTPSNIPGGPPSAGSTDIVIVDRRPADEKRKRILSRWLLSCDHGVYRILEDQGVPDHLGVLKADLVQRLGSGLAGRELVVTHYNLYQNRGVALGAEAMGVGMASAGLGGGGDRPRAQPKCGREKMKGGWFDVSETSNGFSPFVLEIEVLLDGRRYEARAVHSPPQELPLLRVFRSADYKKPEELAAIRAVMAVGHAKLADALSSAVPGAGSALSR